MVTPAERLEQLEYLGLTEEDVKGLVNPFERRTPQDLREPHLHVLRLMRNPDYFYYTAKTLFNIELLPFQCVILKEMWGRRFPMLIGSRGMGKSFLLGLYAVLRALLKQGSKVVICGSGFRQAKTVFAYAEKIWHDSPILQSLVAEAPQQGPAHGADRWVLRIGDSTIVALPIGDGTRIRGERANCIIADEFASIPEQIFEEVISGFGVVNLSPIEKVKKAARRRVLKRMGVYTEEQAKYDRENDEGNQVLISGTAFFDFNHFAKYWKRWKSFVESKGDRDWLRRHYGMEVSDRFNHHDYAVVRYPYDLVPEDYYDVAQIDRSRATIHSGIFANEFGAVFSKDSKGFFPRSLIETCVTSKARPVTPNAPDARPVWFDAVTRGNPKYSYVMGIDPAAEQDNFAITVLECHEDHRRVVYCWTTNKEKFRARSQGELVQEKDYYGYCARKIRELMKAFPCEVIALDAQGGGQNGVLEALHDPDKMKPGERPVWPVTPDHPLSDGKERPDDDQPGLHIVELVNFSKADWVSAANHGLKKDLEDMTLLFPQRDAVTLGEAFLKDQEAKRLFDTLEDCVDEIDDLKEELTTISYSQTPGTLRDKWDTPEVKIAGSKKGRMRKDRYSALLMANYAARRLQRQFETPDYEAHGGFADMIRPADEGEMFSHAPDWFTKQTEGDYGGYGWVSSGPV